MSATGIDLTTKSDHWLKWTRRVWVKQFGKHITSDRTVRDFIKAIDDELTRRDPTYSPPELSNGK